MVDAFTSFCGVFALLSYKLLFWSDRALSLGSVFLTACMAAAIAQLTSGGSGVIDAVGQYVRLGMNHTCGSATPGGPISIACVASGLA